MMPTNVFLHRATALTSYHTEAALTIFRVSVVQLSYLKLQETSRAILILWLLLHEYQQPARLAFPSLPCTNCLPRAIQTQGSSRRKGNQSASNPAVTRWITPLNDECSRYLIYSGRSQIWFCFSFPSRMCCSNFFFWCNQWKSHQIPRVSALKLLGVCESTFCWLLVRGMPGSGQRCFCLGHLCSHYKFILHSAYLCVDPHPVCRKEGIGGGLEPFPTLRNCLSDFS